MKPLVVALAKGRLSDSAMELLCRAGVVPDDLASAIKKRSRRLIFESRERGIGFFMAKPSDVPTYVEYGAADIGIAGKDALLESGRNLYEMLDLGFGSCRMIVAGREASRELVARGNNFRVATKYPRIALDYFVRRKQQSVEIIKLGGSVELAPIVGLSDVIVDIVETGGTLRENGLVVLEEIAPISARMVVNRASMKIEHARIVELIKMIKAVLGKNECDE
ncbi:MAG: ATP phosphoribosyltransferase [Synergistaceae bacterium]|jgi:ATP phosphoribosyltransferase|nr:ATP phosphoribosyltransferase [Synergistaceae bacterium]